MLLLFAVGVTAASAQGYEPGDFATDFRLKNIDGKMMSLSDMPDAKGFIVIFTCNTCPVSVANEERIIELDKNFKSKGYPVIAINPNNPEVQPGDSFDKMIERADDKGFTFPYLLDEGQTVYPAYGAVATPHTYLLKREGDKLKVVYTGAIDNNSRDASAADQHYLADAVNALLAGTVPEVTTTRAIGCSIKK